MTPAAQHTHCDHECVCPDYEFQSDDTGGCLDPCAVIFHGKKRCPHDTRASHPAQQQRIQQAIKELEVLEVESFDYGEMMAYKRAIALLQAEVSRE